MFRVVWERGCAGRKWLEAVGEQEACVWDSIGVVSWDSVAGAGRRVGGM